MRIDVLVKVSRPAVGPQNAEAARFAVRFVFVIVVLVLKMGARNHSTSI